MTSGIDSYYSHYGKPDVSFSKRYECKWWLGRDPIAISSDRAEHPEEVVIESDETFRDRKQQLLQNLQEKIAKGFYSQWCFYERNPYTATRLRDILLTRGFTCELKTSCPYTVLSIGLSSGSIRSSSGEDDGEWDNNVCGQSCSEEIRRNTPTMLLSQAQQQYRTLCELLQAEIDNARQAIYEIDITEVLPTHPIVYHWLSDEMDIRNISLKVDFREEKTVLQVFHTPSIEDSFFPRGLSTDEFVRHYHLLTDFPNLQIRLIANCFENHRLDKYEKAMARHLNRIFWDDLDLFAKFLPRFKSVEYGYFKELFNKHSVNLAKKLIDSEREKLFDHLCLLITMIYTENRRSYLNWPNKTPAVCELFEVIFPLLPAEIMLRLLDYFDYKFTNLIMASIPQEKWEEVVQFAKEYYSTYKEMVYFLVRLDQTEGHDHEMTIRKQSKGFRMFVFKDIVPALSREALLHMSRWDFVPPREVQREITDEQFFDLCNAIEGDDEQGNMDFELFRNVMKMFEDPVRKRELFSKAIVVFPTIEMWVEIYKVTTLDTEHLIQVLSDEQLAEFIPQIIDHVKETRFFDHFYYPPQSHLMRLCTDAVAKDMDQKTRIEKVEVIIRSALKSKYFSHMNTAEVVEKLLKETSARHTNKEILMDLLLLRFQQFFLLANKNKISHEIALFIEKSCAEIQLFTRRPSQKELIQAAGSFHLIFPVKDVTAIFDYILENDYPAEKGTGLWGEYDLPDCKERRLIKQMKAKINLPE